MAPNLWLSRRHSSSAAVPQCATYMRASEHIHAYPCSCTVLRKARRCQRSSDGRGRAIYAAMRERRRKWRSCSAQFSDATVCLRKKPETLDKGELSNGLQWDSNFSRLLQATAEGEFTTWVRTMHHCAGMLVGMGSNVCRGCICRNLGWINTYTHAHTGLAWREESCDFRHVR